MLAAGNLAREGCGCYTRAVAGYGVRLKAELRQKCLRM